MTETTKQLRDLVMKLSIMPDSEWEEIDKVLSKKSDSTVQPKAEPKELSYYEKVKRVTELERMVGIPAHIKGYSYLREAILLMLDEPEKYSLSITKVLYPDVAKRFNTTSNRVGRAIQNAIDVAWKRGDPEIHNKIFGSANSGKPANCEMIAEMTEYVKMYMLV